MNNFNKFAYNLSNTCGTAELKVRGRTYKVKVDNLTENHSTNEVNFEAKVLEGDHYYSDYVWNTDDIFKKYIRNDAAETARIAALYGNFPANTSKFSLDLRNSIDKVIFNNPATIILWKDGTKTVVKCQEGETFDEEKGLAMAISKRVLGDKGNFNEVFKKYVKNEPEKNEEPVADNRGKECEWRTSPVNSIFDFPTYECTACGNRHSMVMKPPAFCPDCGAKITNPKEVKK